MANQMVPSEAVQMARQWQNLNSLRHAAVLVAWLLALKAFAAFQREGRVLI
jgi:hypothetical protein